MNTALLNAIKDRLIQFANDNGILLADHFATRDDFAQFVIAFTVNACVELLNMPTDKALDFVLGDGTFSRIADTVWEELQATA